MGEPKGRSDVGGRRRQDRKSVGQFGQDPKIVDRLGVDQHADGPHTKQLVTIRHEPFPRYGIVADEEEGAGEVLGDGPRCDPAESQAGRADRQQPLDIRSTEIRTRSVGAPNMWLIGAEGFQQRSQRSRVTVVVDDGGLGGDQRRDEKEAEETQGRYSQGAGTLHPLTPPRNPPQLGGDISAIAARELPVVRGVIATHGVPAVAAFPVAGREDARTHLQVVFGIEGLPGIAELVAVPAPIHLHQPDVDGALALGKKAPQRPVGVLAGGVEVALAADVECPGPGATGAVTVDDLAALRKRNGIEDIGRYAVGSGRGGVPGGD